MMQRAVAIGTLAEGSTEILSPSLCDDGLAALRVAEALGAKVERSKTAIRLTPRAHELSPSLDCGEAGLSIRMFSAVAALHAKELTLTASGSLTKRPIHIVSEALSQFGVSVKTNEGYPPISILGPIRGGKAVIDGSLSSQLLTGLLIALPLAKEDSELSVKELKSRPYIDLTLELVRMFGGEIQHDSNYSSFFIPGGQSYRGQSYRVEGDWSGASCVLVAGAIAGELTLSNLRADSEQADIRILEALRLAGAQIKIEQDSVSVKKHALAAFEFDATDCPDLFPAIVALASSCAGKSRIRGVKRLRHKESDRGLVLSTEFNALGGSVSIIEDEMQVEGRVLQGGEAHSHSDHRIAMALAVAALNSKEGIGIDDPDCVNKSYPNFYNDLESITS